LDIKKTKLVIFLIPFVIITAIVLTKVTLGPTFIPYINFISEDGPVEYATVLVYFFTFILSLLSAKIFFKNSQRCFGILYLAMAIFFIFVVFEEISWGQRILNITPSEFFLESTQDETNIHDLPPFSYIEDSSFVLAGFLGGLLWLIFLKSKSTNFFSFQRFFVPGWYMMSYFIPISIFYLILNLTPTEHISPIGIRWNFLFEKEQEPFEFLLSLGFLGFIFTNYLRLKNAAMRPNNIKNT
jgi:hypothetical protein